MHLKIKLPTEQKVLENLKAILNELVPDQSRDVEVLCLSGAINKRLYEISGNVDDLDKSIMYYEKGFQLKQDYYNGINTAFILYNKIAYLKQENQELEDTKKKHPTSETPFLNCH